MTGKELKTWVYSHIEMKTTLVFNAEGHYKLKYENGDTYEYRSVEKGFCKELVTIWINGKIARKALYAETWLDNGSWGNKLIEELPIDNSAA